MNDPRATVRRLATRAEDYGHDYYADRLGSEPYAWESPSWNAFFAAAADRLIAVANPRSVLDVGCARGLLVQALAERGVAVEGLDVSEHAIATAHSDVRDRLRVASAADPLTGSWDLITCIEVLEHMAPGDAELAVKNICSATDRVVFSSGPSDFAEPSHVNVRAAAEWAATFAEHGLFRRLDVDLSFITPWASLFERAALTPRDVVHRYEMHTAPLRAETHAKRAALLESERELTRLREAAITATVTATVTPIVPPVDTAGAEERAALAGENDRLREALHATEQRLLETEHRLLTVRDHAIGAEAQSATQSARAAHAEAGLAAMRATHHAFVLAAGEKTVEHERRHAADADTIVALERQVHEMAESERWRVGGWLLAPVARPMQRRRARRG